MYLKIRYSYNSDGSSQDLIININNGSLVYDVKRQIERSWNIPVRNQKLFFNGVPLSSDNFLMDYDVQFNDIIQLMVVQDCDMFIPCEDLVEVFSKFYADHYTLELYCDTYCAWFPGQIIFIKKFKNTEFIRGMSDEDVERRFIFFVHFLPPRNPQLFLTRFDLIRSKSYYSYKFEELRENMIVSVRYNFNNEIVGRHRYDMCIKELDPVAKIIHGMIDCGYPRAGIPVTMRHNNDILRIEKPTQAYDPAGEERPVFKCMMCYNDADRSCFFCACVVCGLKSDPFCIVRCDECGLKYHFFCISLAIWPREVEWHCPNCAQKRNIAAARKKLRGKKPKKVWGRGMACIRKPKECTLVPVNHFGPIPGIDVGTRWKFRVQVAEAGVHRSHICGIHGRDIDGVYSIVLSTGFTNHIDKGSEILYSGIGGSSYYHNKKIGAQNIDQKLTRSNKALALNCYAEFNTEVGAVSKQWKKGKPIRVCRSSKLRKFSKYAPQDGIRYDGIYKVAKYYTEKNVNGHIVWKFLLKRDDPDPAPWEKNGVEFEILYPDGFLEAMANSTLIVSEKGTPRAGTSKSVHNFSPSFPISPANIPATATSQTDSVDNAGNSEQSNDQENLMDTEILKQNNLNSPESEPTTSTHECRSSKRMKLSYDKKPIIKKSYTLDAHIADLIKTDTLNKSLWDECLTCVQRGKYYFILKVQEIFKCIVCQEVIFEPVTTCSQHNTCLKCLGRSFESEIFECPYCRKFLGVDYKFVVNSTLAEALLLLLPGYEQDR